MTRVERSRHSTGRKNLTSLLNFESTDRPGLQAALHLLARTRTRNVDGLVAAKLDRLSRSVIDFGTLLDLSRKQKWSLAVLDFDLDTSTATGRMIAGIVVQFAQFEREVIGERTRAALAVAKANGAQLGKPSPITPEVRSQILDLHRQGMSASAIARQLTADDVPTARGGHWHHSSRRSVPATSHGGRPQCLSANRFASLLASSRWATSSWSLVS
jgi:DNA invertase Pin-like site-specific DNA recombinase